MVRDGPLTTNAEGHRERGHGSSTLMHHRTHECRGGNLGSMYIGSEYGRGGAPQHSTALVAVTMQQTEKKHPETALSSCAGAFPKREHAKRSSGRSGPGSQLSPHERAASEAFAPCPPSRASTRPRNSAQVAPILDAEVPMSGTLVVRTRGNQRNPAFRDRRFIFPVRPAMGEIPSHLTAEIRSRASSFPPHDSCHMPQ